MRQVTEDALRRGLSSEDAPAKEVRIKPYRVGVKPAYRGMSMNQLYDQLEAESAARQDLP